MSYLTCFCAFSLYFPVDQLICRHSLLVFIFDERKRTQEIYLKHLRPLLAVLRWCNALGK